MAKSEGNWTGMITVREVPAQNYGRRNGKRLTHYVVHLITYYSYEYQEPQAQAVMETQILYAYGRVHNEDIHSRYCVAHIVEDLLMN